MIFIFLGLTFHGCSDDDGAKQLCDFDAQIDADLFRTAPQDDLIINALGIEDDCVVFEFSASGCDGGTWEIKLVDSGAVMESLPPQRNLILSLKNEEVCDAVITKVVSFDISNLQVEGDGVRLNIINTAANVLYEY